MREAREAGAMEEQGAPTGRHVAVVGMAGRFPGARDLRELWRNLREGREAVRRFSDDELLAAGVDPALLADPGYVKAGSVLDGADLFDAPFFGFSAREAELLDPQQRLFLEQVWHALEDAGYAGARSGAGHGGLVGLYAGVAWNTYLLANLASRPELFGGAGGFQVFITNDKDFMPTRVSYKLDLRGPSVVVQTSCSTSLVAIHLACLSLLSYECDLALAGGVTVKVPQVAGYHYEEGGLASPDGSCRAFDARAAGTVFGSGVGVVALKRLDDALADGDAIRAVIRGSAINNDGSAKVSYTAPSVEGQAEVIAAAQAVAGVAPDTLRYVEAHGTGTSLGDPIEVAALTRVFREGTDRRGFCGLGSIKTNLGHLDAASGVAGLIKTVLALEHRELPPSLHFEEPNPEIDFAASPFYVQRALEAWERDGAPRRAGVSSFGVGGTNAHVVLEEAPEAPAPAPARPWQLLPVSARSEAALRESVARLAAWLREAEPPAAGLADVAHTLQVGRGVFRHRAFAVCRDGADAAAAFEGGELGRLETGVDEDEPRERAVAFLFPDLAPADTARLPEPSRELYEHEPVHREWIDLAAGAAAPLVGLDLRTVLGTGEASAAGHDRPEAVRAALFAFEHALARLWISWGVRPRATLGYGLGSAVADCLQGTLSLEEALARAVGGEGGPAGERFEEDLAALFGEPDRVLLEVGPGAALTDLAARHPDRARRPAIASLDAAEDGRRRLLTALGRLWLAGVRVDWAGVRGGERRRRVPLPLYPFEGRRFWIDPAPRAAATAEESGELVKRPDPADWLYLPSWRRTLPPAAAGPAAAEDQGWLVLRRAEEEGAGTAGFGRLLAERLRAAGRRVAEAAPGASFRALGEDAYEVDPARPEDWRALAAALAAPGGPPRHVLHAWLLDGPAGGEVGAAASVESFEAAQRLGFHAFAHLFRALDTSGDSDRGLDLTVVADRLLAVTGEEPLAPEKAPLLALCRVLPQERAGAAARAVDVVLPPSDRARDPAELAALADRVVAEALAVGGDREVALRRGERWVPAYEPVRVEAGGSAPFRREGVYLVTGGLAGNGLALARFLAREHGARLALVEGPELPADAAERAAELEALGGRALILPLGVAWGNEVAWRRVLARIEERFGALHGVIHAAGASGERAFRTLAEVGEEESAWHFGPKVHGLLALDAALAGRRLDVRVLLSSLASVLGGVAYGPYAAANRFLDAFAAARARSGGAPWLALGWDLWRLETGEDAITGIRSDLAELEMAPREGEEAFRRAVALAAAPALGGRLLVSTADLPRRIARQDERAGERRGRLRAPAALHPRPALGVPYEAPAGELEERIAAVWGRALGFEEVGVLDNFFDLGGDSFVAIQVASELRDALGVELPAAKLYQGLTVRSLAALLAADEGTSAAARAGELEERRAAMGRRRNFLERRRARRVAEVADE